MKDIDDLIKHEKINQKNPVNKVFAYLITCISFAAINYLLNAYSFVKKNIMDNFYMN